MEIYYETIRAMEERIARLEIILRPLIQEPQEEPKKEEVKKE